MKITGLNTWGSDILFTKPTYAIDFLKCLLSVDIIALRVTQLTGKTANHTSSLHLWIKKNLNLCVPVMATKTTFGLFHIVEQGNEKSTAVVNKKNQNKGVQRFAHDSFVPYYGMVKTFSVRTH
jgi:hypothetical protein